LNPSVRDYRLRVTDAATGEFLREIALAKP
jgi:hypothetical protein